MIKGDIIHIRDRGMFSVVRRELMMDRNAHRIECDAVVNVTEEPVFTFKDRTYFEVSIGEMMRAEKIATLEFYSTILNSTYCVWKKLYSKSDINGAIQLDPIEMHNRDSFIKVFGIDTFNKIVSEIEEEVKIEKELDKEE